MSPETVREGTAPAGSAFSSFSGCNVVTENERRRLEESALTTGSGRRGSSFSFECVVRTSSALIGRSEVVSTDREAGKRRVVRGFATEDHMTRLTVSRLPHPHLRPSLAVVGKSLRFRRLSNRDRLSHQGGPLMPSRPKGREMQPMRREAIRQRTPDGPDLSEGDTRVASAQSRRTPPVRETCLVQGRRG